MDTLSKTQIDRLGERLKREDYSDVDLEMLNAYKVSFGPAYKEVISSIKQIIPDIEPAERLGKTNKSIIAKLKRGTTHLSQMQDIAACRLVVPNILSQNKVLSDLERKFHDCKLVDRRTKPSYGYRAMHVIIKHCDKWVEVQVRTELQHAWAQTSEDLADQWGLQIKYGGGDEEIQRSLSRWSVMIKDIEAIELRIESKGISVSPEIKQQVNQLKKQMLDNLSSLSL